MSRGIRDFFNDRGASAKYAEPAPSTPSGRPIRNVPPGALLREAEGAQARKALNVAVKILDLFDPEQLKEYREILDRIANRSWSLIRRSEAPEFADGRRHWWVKIEYADVYALLPNAMARHFNGGQTSGPEHGFPGARP